MLIECQIVDNCKKGLGYENYNVVPPPYKGNFMPPTPDLSFTSLNEFVNTPVVKNCKAMSSEEEPKVVRKYDDAPSIKNRCKKFNTARPKEVVNAVKGNIFNVVKASACWVWKPKHNVLDHVSKHNIEHQLKFNSIKDVKKLLEAVEKRFELLDEKLLQEDVNQKLLRSLSPEWNTHAVVWRNKADLDTMSMDDLYNNLKVYKPEVKGMSSSSSSIHNMAFVSSSNNNTSSTNGAVNTAHGVSTTSTQINDAYSININNLSDAVICTFFASQPNSPRLVHEDLQQIHPDDIEEMDLRWQMAMLTMRARRFLKNIVRKLTVNGNETISFDKSVPAETSTSIALMPCDGLGGYDQSDQAEVGPNYALMAFSSSSPDSEVSNGSIYSKSCLETIELLKSQNDQLLKDLTKTELMVLGYKTSLESVKEKLEVYKENESIYLQDIKGLKFEIHIGEITIRELRKKLEIVQKEKDGIQLNVDKFKHASKSLNKLIECQIVDNCKKDEFVNKPVVENYRAMSSEEEHKVVRMYDDAPSIEEWVSDDEKEDVSQPKTEKKTVRPTIVKNEFVKSKQQEKLLGKLLNNEHQLNFNSIKDAKKLLESIEKRFGGNAATRKTQRNLLKQKYENFTAPSSEMLD
ncbi:hypothetical protein Tco_0735600 [Tanacetum coccineum]